MPPPLGPLVDSPLILNRTNLLCQNLQVIGHVQILVTLVRKFGKFLIFLEVNELLLQAKVVIIPLTSST